MVYLHHQQDRVEDNENHDEVLERRGDDHSPYLVLEAVHLLGHVALQRFSLDGKVDAGFLQQQDDDISMMYIIIYIRM
jgi:hypothetical protein